MKHTSSVEVAHHCAQQVRDVFHQATPAHGRRLAAHLVECLPTCPIPEIAHLGQTLHTWKDAHLAYFDTAGASNTPHRSHQRNHRTRQTHHQRLPQPHQPPTPNAPHHRRPRCHHPHSTLKSHQCLPRARHECGRGSDASRHQHTDLHARTEEPDRAHDAGQDTQTPSRGHPGLLRPPPHRRRFHRSHQRTPRTPTRIRTRVSKPRQLHHSSTPRNRRIQGSSHLRV